MSISKGMAAVVLMGLLAIIGLWAYGCNDKPTDPPPPEPPKDYVFYFNDGGYADTYYRYFSVSKKVDTVTIPFNSRSGLAIAADGARLYLPDGVRTVVVTADSFQVVAELDYSSSGGVSVSPNGEYVAICGSHTTILRTDDYSVIFSDTVTSWRGVFSRNSRRFYCVTYPGVATIDLTSTPCGVSQTVFDPGHAFRVLPSLDENRLFVYRQYGTFDFSFDVYDIASDSIVFRDPQTPGFGDLEITPDGKYVFYTNPGSILVGPPPPPYFKVYDVEGNKIYKEISLIGYTLAQHLAISPDGRTLVAESGPGFGDFIALDVATMEITDLIYLGQADTNRVDLWDVACQTGL